MPFVDSLGYTVWLVTAVLHLATLYIMSKKRLASEMPIFFCYTAFQLIRSAALFAIRSYNDPSDYFYSYWGAEIISVVFAFLVIQEIYLFVLRPYDGIRQLSMLIWKWAIAVLFLLSTGYAALASTIPSTTYIRLILALEQGTHMLQCGLIVFLFFFAAGLGIHWRHYAFGVALGFGLNAAVDLAVAAGFNSGGQGIGPMYVLLKPLAYACCAMLWFVYLLAPAPDPVIETTIESQHLARWNESVLEILQR